MIERVIALATLQSKPQRIEARIGTLEFTHDFANGFPTDTTIEKLYDERDFQRACQAYLWSLPAVSGRAFCQASLIPPCTPLGGISTTSGPAERSAKPR